MHEVIDKFKGKMELNSPDKPCETLRKPVSMQKASPFSYAASRQYGLLLRMMFLYYLLSSNGNTIIYFEINEIHII